MACGVPVIGTAVGGINEAVVDGVTGILVPAYGINELAAGVLRIASNPDLHERMGQAAREMAVEKFDITTSVKRHVQAFEMALERG
jgi:glycosyltransferase involved in cell wall biosynthesis